MNYSKFVELVRDYSNKVDDLNCSPICFSRFLSDCIIRDTKFIEGYLCDWVKEAFEGCRNVSYARLTDKTLKAFHKHQKIIYATYILLLLSRDLTKRDIKMIDKKHFKESIAEFVNDGVTGRCGDMRMENGVANFADPIYFAARDCVSVLKPV